MLDLAPYLQRAVLEIALLAVPAGLLGSWIVLRRLAFFTHAVGTVSFPALVLAGAWVKKASRRRTIQLPSSPAGTASSAISSRARCR